MKSKLPNSFGLYDMMGNVSELCFDEFFLTYKRAPSNGAPVSYYNFNNGKSLRGGSWLDLALFLRSASRMTVQSHLSTFYVGVRPVCSID